MSTILDGELLEASSEGNEWEIRRLLGQGADKNVVDKNQKTPLIFACLSGNLASVRALLQAGADLKKVDDYMSSPLHVAAELGFVDIVDVLIRFGSDKNSGNMSDSTPLLLAAGKGRDAVCELLIRSGADVDRRNSKGRSALDCAIFGQHRRTIEILISAGASVNVEAKKKIEALFGKEEFARVISCARRELSPAMTVDQVGAWLVSRGADDSVAKFAEEKIDGEALMHLEEEDLQKLGVKVGPKRKILASIREARAPPAVGEPPAPPDEYPRFRSEIPIPSASAAAPSAPGGPAVIRVIRAPAISDSSLSDPTTLHDSLYSPIRADSSEGVEINVTRVHTVDSQPLEETEMQPLGGR